MKEIPLTHGMVTLVDDEDYEGLSKFKWYPQVCTHTTYVIRHENGGTPSMHRHIMNGPSGMDVDHIDGNGLNNQKSNMRIVTHKENCQNRHLITPCHNPHIPRELAPSGKTIVKCWKSSSEDESVLIALTIENEKNGVFMSESAMVRAGLRALAEKKGVKYE